MQVRHETNFEMQIFYMNLLYNYNDATVQFKQRIYNVYFTISKNGRETGLSMSF